MKLLKKPIFPSTFFNVVYGDGELGKCLLQPGIDFIHFTGSSAVGREVYKRAAELFVPATLEMGGSSPAIVMPGADIEKAATSIFLERFKNCGQICCALKRLYAHESIIEELSQALCQLAARQVIGDPLDEATTLGPLASPEQRELIEDQLRRGLSAGAEILTGGSRPDLEGAFFEATLVSECASDSPLIQEEVFGPVLPIVAFKELEEAIRLANDSAFGLSAFIYAKDENTALRIASEIDAGQVSINGASYFSNHAPFGGFKMSGIGRVRGDEGLRETSQIKVLGLPPR